MLSFFNLVFHNVCFLYCFFSLTLVQYREIREMNTVSYCLGLHCLDRPLRMCWKLVCINANKNSHFPKNKNRKQHFTYHLCHSCICHFPAFKCDSNVWRLDTQTKIYLILMESCTPCFANLFFLVEFNTTFI